MTLNTDVTAATPTAMMKTAKAANAGSRRMRRSAYLMSSRVVLMATLDSRFATKVAFAEELRSTNQFHNHGAHTIA